MFCFCYKLIDKLDVYLPYAGYITVRLLDINGDVRDVHPEGVRAAVFTIPRYRGPVSSIELTATHDVLMCEFEAYGECAPPVFGADCDHLCSSSCEDQLCTFNGFCRDPCPNGTGGTHCFEGCVGWCEDYEEHFLTNPLVTENTSSIPQTRQLGFHMEHFWFYVMMTIALVAVLCISGLNRPEEESRGSSLDLDVTVDVVQNHHPGLDPEAEQEGDVDDQSTVSGELNHN
ncbi:hypothetical protein Btru_070458 [Bulinus truncatus]|nr:hypothetical protein Btru_070458 [Bulinus truncatus]